MALRADVDEMLWSQLSVGMLMRGDSEPFATKPSDCGFDLEGVDT